MTVQNKNYRCSVCGTVHNSIYETGNYFVNWSNKEQKIIDCYVCMRISTLKKWGVIK